MVAGGSGDQQVTVIDRPSRRVQGGQDVPGLNQDGHIDRKNLFGEDIDHV